MAVTEEPSELSGAALRRRAQGAKADQLQALLTSLATQGKGALLRNYAHGALQAGVSARKIHEALVELVVYAGFPTATSMLFEWQQALLAARRQGMAIREDIGETENL